MSMTEIGKLEEHEWDQLLDMISDGSCTPFLGAGVNAGLLPLGSTVARQWAKESNYPLENCDALDQVAEFVSIQSDNRATPKRRFVKLLRSELEQVDLGQLEAFLRAPDQPLGVLARLPLPIYITTNYDNLLMRALEAQGKNARRELCRWYDSSKESGAVPASLSDPEDASTPDKDHPLVFHLHGHEEVPDSLVLSEDDYLDFLIAITRGRVLPPLVEKALTSTTLLFIGYRLADVNFRVTTATRSDDQERRQSAGLPRQVPHAGQGACLLGYGRRLRPAIR
jgi:hypothetical protein